MNLRLRITEHPIADDLRRVAPVVYYVGAQPIEVGAADGRYRGVLQQGPPEVRHVVWSCEHRHRLARKAWECGATEARRRRAALR